MPTTSATRKLYIDAISRTDVVPYIGTARQLQRTIAVAGSARTAAAVTIEHETTALGDVLAYFWSTTVPGYSPPLRQYRSGGGDVSTDSTFVSGAVENLTTPATFDVPVSQLPQGLFTLMVRVSTLATVDLTYSAQLRLNGTDVGAAVSGTRSVNAVTGNPILALGRLMLPPVATAQASPAVVRVTLSASASCFLDEAWLFHSDGQLIQVACGAGTPASGGPANRVFIEPATVSVPRPTIRIGHAADGSDSFFPPGLSAWQMPQFTPPEVNVLTVSTQALSVAATLRHRPGWHTHAAF